MYKTTWQEGSRWNMFKALANGVAGHMQKENKSSNFSPAKYNWKPDFIFKNSVLSLPADISGKLTQF